MEFDQEYFDKKFEKIDKSFEVVDKKFDLVDKRFESVDRKFDAVEKKFELLDTMVESVESNLKKDMDFRFAKVHRHIDQKIEWLARLVANSIAQPYQKRLDNHETRIKALEAN